MEIAYRRIIYGNAVVLVGAIVNDSNQLSDWMQNPFYKKEMETIQSPKRLREMLTVRLMLNDYLRENVHIRYRESGQPYVANHPCSISISHSRKYVALFVHPETVNVGVDIECSNRQVEKAASRFLSTTEWDYLTKLDHPAPSMLLVWSAKEAMYKIIGESVAAFSTALQVEPFLLQPFGEVVVQVKTANPIQLTLQYEMNDNYCLVYGAEKLISL